MFVYLFCSQCPCRYIMVTVRLIKENTLEHSSQCSIYTTSCCSYEGYTYVVTCISRSSTRCNIFRCPVYFQHGSLLKMQHRFTLYNCINCIKIVFVYSDEEVPAQEDNRKRKGQ